LILYNIKPISLLFYTIFIKLQHPFGYNHKIIFKNILGTYMKKANINGKVWTFGKDIDTDLIIAARYLNTSVPEELAKHVMEDADPEFVKNMRAGDIIVAGENFGCGSSREHAPIALKAAGVAAVIAPTFARIFYRNAFNMGLPIFELPQSAEINQGDEVTVDMNVGTVTNNTTGKTYNFIPIPAFMQELIDAGGLMNFAKNEIKGQ
jgi:3-isopropylmalate/(R)-2-methylmalate dehydratase small subunit